MDGILKMIGVLAKGINDAVELHAAEGEAAALASLEATINSTSVKIAKMIADGEARRKTIAAELAAANAKDNPPAPAPATDNEPTKP